MSWLEKLKTLADQLVREAVPADPASFKDALALQVDWTPASGGGANFRTHRLHDLGAGRYEFRSTGTNTFFSLIFILMGAGAMTLFAVAGQQNQESSLLLGLAVPGLICGLFVGIGIFLLLRSRRAIVFDRGRGWFWIGKDPQQTPRAQACRLGDIYALQLIKERCSSKNSSYWSYELNLVLRDRGRINVVDHGDVERLREDARKLALVLGCKLWDATAPAAQKTQTVG